jgi:hypothetical protein
VSLPQRIDGARLVIPVAQDGTGIALADAQSPSAKQFGLVGAVLLGLNGSGTYDLVRAPLYYGSYIPSAARTAFVGGAGTTAYQFTRAQAHLQITSAPNTSETLTMQFVATQAPGGPVGNVLVASITTVAGSSLQSGTANVFLWLGSPSTATISANYVAAFAYPVPPRLAVQVVPSGGSSWTYSVDLAIY